MSLALKVFTENFLRGLQLGTNWQDKAEDRDIKKSTLKYQLAKMEQDAAYKRATLAETARRNSAYVNQSGAYADYLHAKAGAVGAKGKGGPAGPDPNVQAFALDPRVNEPGLATPPPAAPTTVVNAPEAEPAAPSAPPADDPSVPDDGYRRGGSVRVPRTRKFAAGGGVGALDSRMKYQVRRAEQTARVAAPTTRLSRPLRAPSFDPVPRMARGGPVALNTLPPGVGAGTNGPGSGFGDVAAPPPGGRYANGGTVADPVENLWNSYYQPQQSPQPGPVGRMASAFGAGYSKSASRDDRAQRTAQPTAPLPAPTIQRTASAPVPPPDGGVPDGNDGYARGGTVRFDDGGGVPDPRYTLPMTEEEQRIRLENPDAGAADLPYARGGERPRSDRTFRNPPPAKDSDDEGEQQRQARAARERNPSKRNWVPPGKAPAPPSFVGEEARADETPTPSTYEPGDSGPRQPPEQVMPPVTVAAPRSSNGGGRGAPPQRRLLGDQRRTAAYDPEADRMDPRNTGITEPGGAVNPRVWAATAEAHPDAYPDDNKGMFGERLDRPGPNPVAADATTGSAINIGAPGTAPAPDNYAAKGASRYAANTFQGDDQHALFAGKGAATHPEMADIFKVVDPDNKLPMHEKMMVGQRAVHDYWMAKGDPKQADQAAFEIGQFGNTMARQHGAKAAKALASGDEKSALNELMAGYGWLPDGGTPTVQNNAIVIRGPNGAVQTTIPLQPGTLHNLALGMATGQLGWDVMHAAAGKQVAASPSAQPQAASAGPQPSPAAPQGAQPPSAGGQGAGEPAAPQVAQAPASPPVSQTPTATPPAPPRSAPPGAPPAAPPGPPPAQMGPEGGGAISTAPPTTPAAPAPAPQVPPTAGSAAPVPPSPSPPQGQGQRVDPQAEAEQQHWAKNPYTPMPEKNSAQQKRDDAIELANRERIHAEQQIVEAANAHGLAGKGKIPAVVTQAIAAKKKIYDDKVKNIEADYRANETERQRNNQPRPIGLNDEATIDNTFNTRTQTLAKAPAGSMPAKFRDDSVLRYATGDDQQTIKSIASNIWQHNKGLTSQQAMDLALTSTSILRPTEQEKDPVGQNRQKGAKATRFTPSNRGDKGLTYLTFGDGTSIKVDSNTYQRIAQQHRENWQQWADSQTKEGQQRERDKKMGLNWKTAGAALRASTALVPGLPLITEGVGGVLGSMNRGR
jgi:hypothetical protein